MACSLKDYLLERIDIDSKTGCWNWNKSLSGYRYGTAWFEGKAISAHRASYMAFIGNIPEGLNACHKCDNTRCINPSHIFLGTQKENIADSRKKGRFGLDLYYKNHNRLPPSGREIFLKGENHKMAKLSEEDVYKIKDLLNKGIKQICIAKEFAIDQSTVSDIKRRKHWKHIGDQNEL